MMPADSINRHFADKTVILTGAASGIGRALARALAEAGAVVHALDANAAGLASLTEENPGPGVIHPVVMDVCDIDRYGAAVDRIRETSGSIDYLFNNAGITLLGESHKLPFDRWKRILDINLMGVVNGIQLVYPLMIAQGNGHIISTASLAGATGYATAAAYAASKSAVLELSRSLHAEAKAYGVRISVACPGYVDSGIFQQESILGAERDAVIRDFPVRMMTPDEAAGHLLKGVTKRKRVIVFPFSARFLWALAHLTPFLINRMQGKLLRVFQ